MKTDFNSFISATYRDNEYSLAIRKLFEDDGKEYSFHFLQFPQKSIEYILDPKHDKYNETLYQLLDAYEELFIKEELKERYWGVYCQIYYCLYRLLRRWETQDGNENLIRNKDWIQNKWLSICVNSVSDRNIEYIFQTGQITPESDEPIDAENQILDILFDEGQLRKEFDKPEREPYLESVSNWFLKRYDLITAFRIISQTEEDKFLFWLLKRVYRTRSTLIIILLILSLVITIPLLTKLSISSVISENNFLNNFPIFKNPNTEFFNKDAVVYNNLISPILAIIYLVLPFFILYFIIRGGVVWLKLIVPRLVAAIILGFFVLWATDEIWKYSMSIEPWAAIIIFLFSNLIAYLYLKIEINNAKVAPLNIKIRAAIIWLLGIVESLTIALVVSDFASQYFIPIENHRPLCGVFGIIYPQVVFIYSALALLIGIFVQIIWEEKPITHPL